MKNRMREICTSGSVRGGGGNVPTYSARDFGDRTGPGSGGIVQRLESAYPSAWRKPVNAAM